MSDKWWSESLHKEIYINSSWMILAATLGFSSDQGVFNLTGTLPPRCRNIEQPKYAGAGSCQWINWNVAGCRRRRNARKRYFSHLCFSIESCIAYGAHVEKGGAEFSCHVLWIECLELSLRCFTVILPWLFPISLLYWKYFSLKQFMESFRLIEIVKW